MPKTTPTVTLYRAAIDTSNFTFEAYDLTAAAAKKTLKLAWAKHVTETGAWDICVQNDIEDLTPYPVSAGQAFRDYALLLDRN